MNLHRDGTGNGLSNTKELLQKVCSYKCQFCTKVYESWRLVSQSQVYMMAGQNIKQKYLMCQIPIKMLKQHAIPNSILHNLKIYSSKEVRKTSHHSNSKYSKFQQKMSLRLLVFASTGEYFYYWHWWVLPNVFQSKYDAKTFKSLAYYFTLCAHKSSYVF